jgi:hypothetical protein
VKVVRIDEVGDWARSEIAREPLLDPIRDDPLFPR